MKELITISIELLISSATFYLGFLVIRNSTTPTFKRFYLLAWMFFSVLFPLISVQSNQYPDVSISQVVKESSSRPQPNLELKDFHSSDLKLESIPNRSDSRMVKKEANSKLDWFFILKAGYIFVTGFFLLRLMIGLIQIIRLRVESKLSKEEGVLVLRVKEPKFKGASFFGWIFIGDSVKEDRPLIIRHERIHYKLGHSIDIVLSHLYCVVFWANPFSWILKKNIGLNTEYEADAKMLKLESRVNYANTLLSLSYDISGSRMMNHFSAFHIKSRIVALTKTIKHKNWVSIYSIVTVLGLFFIISCENVNSSEVMVERMSEVKTITTRFTSHQSDTRQKTGRIVAIASFSPDGTLNELVEQTTYPYDREYEVKKSFWEVPEKSGIPYVMDGLSLGNAEKSFLYGHDWPSAYYKHLYAKTKSRDMPWSEIVETDNELLPNEIITRREFRESDENVFIDFGMPDVTEYYEYDNEKVINVSSKSVYRNLEHKGARNKALADIVEKNTTKEQREFMERLKSNSGKIMHKASYEYEGELLKSIKHGDSERRFYYENDLMIKSEYLRSGEVINTRIHYYKNSLKDRTEIFNRYNEPEYTITYEYEFW